MSMRRMVALQACLLSLALFANAVSRRGSMQITVLASETRALPQDDNGVPTNCDQLTFDAYCRSTSSPRMASTLVVQEGNGPPFRITCTIESKYSRCTPLPKGVTFEARREKRGITVYYVDDKGKARSQLYHLVDIGGKTSPPAAAVANQTVSAAVAPSQPPAAARQRASNDNGASYARADAAPPLQNSAQTSGAPGPGWVKAGNLAKVKCNFNSTPAGAEISVDGKFVGNTPSEIALSAGAHQVVLSMPGFAAWKRELTVSVESALNVNPVLQKEQ
jgi:PEGA domain